MSTHTALEVDAEGAVAWAAEHPGWYIFPGRMVEDPDSGSFRKRPAPGLRWNVHAAKDPDGIRALWAQAGGTGVIAVAMAPSNLWALDDDRDIEDELWNSLLEAVRISRGTLVLQSCTKGRPHYIFKQGGEYVAESTWPGGDIKSSGYIFVSSLPPLVKAGVQPAPRALLDKLKKTRPTGGHGRGLCSVGDLWDWLATTPEPEDLILDAVVGEKFLDAVIEHMNDSVDKGEHRRQAARDAVFQAGIESSAGCYSAETAYEAIRGAYRALREARGEHGDRGWSRERERDYDHLWQSMVPAIQAGDYADKIDTTRDEVLERYPRFDDDEWTDEEIDALLEGMRAASADVGSFEADSQPTYEPVSPESLDPSTGEESPSTGKGSPSRAEPSTSEPWPVAAKPADPAPLSLAREQPVIDEAAYWGPHGDLVEALRGRTESSDVGVLGCLLAFAGATLAGRAHFQVGVDVHGPNDYILNIGASSAARKSSALSLVDKGIYFDPARLKAAVTGGYFLPRKLSGIASGEILVKQWMPTTEKTETGEKIEEYPERRVLMIESEASVVWKRAQRSGAVLSDIYCKLWDQTDLATAAVTSGSTYVPHDRHLMGFMGCSTLHVAVAAAKAGDGTDAKSGFANRFLWLFLPDSKVDLPFGASLPTDAVRRYQDRLGLFDGSLGSIDEEGFGQVAHFDEAAAERWSEAYGSLKRNKGAAGFIEGMLSRGESHVLRLALNYWLASGGDPTKVGLPALEAALAVWAYAKASVEYIFGDSTGDRDSDNLVAELATRGGWAMMEELRADLNKNTLAGLVKSGVEAGVLRDGVRQDPGRPGRHPRAVCIAEWLRYGKLAPESNGVLRGRGTPLSSITWH